MDELARLEHAQSISNAELVAFVVIKKCILKHFLKVDRGILKQVRL